MRTIQCKKLGSVTSITVGAVYNIIEETEDRFIIVNDKGVQSRYGKNLFNDPVNVPEEPQMELNRPARRGPGRPPRAQRAAEVGAGGRIPQPAPERVIPVIDSIEVHTSANNAEGNIGFFVRFMFNPNFILERRINRIISTNGISASCGIQSLSGLDDLNREISLMRDAFMAYVREHSNDFTLSADIDINNLFEEIPVALIQDLVASYQGEDADVKAGILILSTTQESIERHPATKRALDRVDPNNIAVNNPNSGNDIVMWNIAVNA